MKKLRVFKGAIFCIIFIMLIAGCSTNNTKSLYSEASPGQTTPTQNTLEEKTIVKGNLFHGFYNPQIDEKGKMLPLQYNGGELTLDYSVRASGDAKNVGFLIFVDGKPQPYKLNKTVSSYQYMHTLQVKEDDQDTPFTFLFTPIIGKSGDNLHVSIVSVYNPSFIPDMKETTSYGGYQTTLETGTELIFNQDTEMLDIAVFSQQEGLSNVHQSTEPVTEDLLKKHSVMEKVDIEALEKRVFSDLSVNGETKQDNFKMDKSGKLKIRFKLFGHPDLRYRNTFYINHKALDSEEVSSFETVLSKGNAVVVDAEIELDKLEDFNTFYVVSVPINANDFPDDVIIVQKTPSLLLYK
ncbi:beta-glucanase/beta-glucan synthetase [Paenibacillus lutrae]|uniref:Beta-glucanase/beta-glucan synthetase n=1 Tax=Paenibacillus lutrae TaxID=2078573 RepID=A0A7X3FH84_9BACL|nr:beta-glucanase/beta-glucan synthetase [Paenibacillus lutrae]MVO99728.1 beta-glucanase/beta-glucan synthetase [Paenibacillus lutrae]